MQRKEIYLFLLIGIVSLSLATAGFFTGRYLTLRNIRKELTISDRGRVIGQLFSPKKLEAVSQAYGDKAAFLSKAKEIIWSVDNVPTPFVNNGPAPGRRGNTSINSVQLRSDRELTLPKPRGVYRIFLTGGSVAFGSGAMSQDHTIAGYLEVLLNARLGRDRGVTYEVFTAANPAWASTHERIFIENRLSEWEPDLVIAFSGNNDVYWGFLGENILWFWSSYYDRYLLKCLQQYLSFGHKKIQDVTTKDAVPVSPELVAARLEKNIRLSADCLKIARGRFMFALQPNFMVTRKALSSVEATIKSKDSKREAYFKECYHNIDRGLKEMHLQNLQYINFSDVFDDIPANETIFIDHFHYGDKGNDIVAKAIFNNIKNIIAK